MSDECVFCKIVRGEASARIVEERIHTLIFHPLNPVVPGHLLVIPKRHVDNFATDPLISGYTAVRASEYVKDTDGEYNLITSKGPNATQTVRHLHFHIVPRWPNDGLALPWSGQEKKAS